MKKQNKSVDTSRMIGIDDGGFIGIGTGDGPLLGHGTGSRVAISNG